MKKIGIDARLYSQTGIGTYLQNLLHYLDKKNHKNEVYYIYLREQDAVRVKFKSKNIIKRIADQKWHSLSEQISFLALLTKDNLDLMHFTYFSYPIFYWRKFVITVHDTTPLIFKTGKASTKNQLLYQIKHVIFRFVFWLQVSRAANVMTPTETVKNELIKIYGSKISKKIQPIYEGISYKIIELDDRHSGKPFDFAHGKRASGNERAHPESKTFFIYVGNFYPHKNVERLIDAFSQVSGGYRLILLGPGDFFTARILHYINIMKSKNKIILIKNPSLEDLVFFYKNAQAIIHPSLSEGFGLPLIEASYFGTPIIASKISVFKELWDNQYLSFDPYDVNDIIKKINLFIKKKPAFDYKSILEKYSFEKMTEETLKIYHKVTQNS